MPSDIRILRTATLALAAAALALPAAARASAWPNQPTLPLAVSTLGPRESAPSAVADAGGGAYVVWEQSVGGGTDICAQHYLADGTRAPGWPAAGVVVCGAAGAQSGPVAAADGSGGLLVAWLDARTPANGTDVFVQRITAAGTVAPGWTPNGVAVTSRPENEMNPVLIADGSGGAMLAWDLVFTANTDLDVQAAHVNASGTLVFAAAVAAPGGLQYGVVGCSDGAGGAILAWHDAFNSRIAAQRVGPTGTHLWTSGHVSVHTSAGGMARPRIATDGAGGAFVAWIGLVSASSGTQLFARLRSDGSLFAPALDTFNSVAVGVGTPVYPAALHEIGPDGAGGFYSAFSPPSGSYPVLLTRRGPNGSTSYGWPVTGLEVVSSSYPTAGSITPPFTEPRPDGAGGVYLAATLVNAEFLATEIRVVRLGGNAVPPAAWSIGGLLVGASSSLAGQPRLAVLPGGHAFVAWESEMGKANDVVLAARVDRHGWLGDPSPDLVSARDVTGDQGGHVRVSWTGSDLDADPWYVIGNYRVWKQVPAAAASLRGVATAPARGFAEPDLPAGTRIAEPTAAGVTYWELAGTQAAQGLPAYSMTVATTGDSVDGSNPRTVFMVTAVHVYQNQFWNSDPDSGYSVDNLPPPAPVPFTATFEDGQAALHWGPSPAGDFHAFRLYRGATPGFEITGAAFVCETTDTGRVDAFGVPRYYKLVAVDVHGNVGPPSLASAGTVVDVPAPAPAGLALSPPAPNPARGRFRLAFTLPRSEHVRLRVHDLQGRVVRTLVDGERAAGPQESTWDGDDERGTPVPPGVFLLRLETQRESRERRIVRIR